VTLTTSAQCRQALAGQPIQITGQLSSDNYNGDSFPTSWVVAVTTTNVLPSPLSAASHFEGGAAAPLFDTWWDTLTESDNYGSGGGVPLPGTSRITLTKYLRLDSNFQAGRYLWFIGTADNPAAGSSVPTQHAGSYLIT